MGFLTAGSAARSRRTMARQTSLPLANDPSPLKALRVGFELVLHPGDQNGNPSEVQFDFVPQKSFDAQKRRVSLSDISSKIDLLEPKAAITDGRKFLLSSRLLHTQRLRPAQCIIGDVHITNHRQHKRVMNSDAVRDCSLRYRNNRPAENGHN